MAILPSFKVQDIVDLFKKGATIEAQEKIMEIREAALELQEENLELKERIRELEQQQEIKDSLVWDGVVYWIKDKNSNEREGPYCQPCWDKEKNLVRLQRDDSMGYTQWYCAVSEKFFSQE